MSTTTNCANNCATNTSTPCTRFWTRICAPKCKEPGCFLYAIVKTYCIDDIRIGIEKLNEFSINQLSCGDLVFDVSEETLSKKISDLLFDSGKTPALTTCPNGPVIFVNFDLNGSSQNNNFDLSWFQRFLRFISKPKRSDVAILHFISFDMRLDDALSEFISVLRARMLLRLGIAAYCHSRDLAFWLPTTIDDEKKQPLVVTWYSESFLWPFEASGWEDLEIFVQQRLKILDQLNIESKVPIFREMRSLEHLCNFKNHETLLRSPHNEILLPKNHGLKGGFQSVIFGDFDFYHYEPEDRGWGCAYRSVQMIVSWLILNGFLDLPSVPSIMKIQEKLIGMGVMDNSFYSGCQKWIGSQEIAWFLSAISNGAVECRFLFVSAKDMVKCARDMQEHFDMAYSPVVVCGANIALTMLGVASDPNSTQLDCGTKFLIADPHYEGLDKLSDVVSKSSQLGSEFKAPAVAWRNVKQLCKSDADYTVVLPSCRKL